MLTNLVLPIQAGTYAAGNCVGGIILLPNLAPVTGRCAIVDAQLVDKNTGNVGVGYELHFFDSLAGTYADKTAFNATDADRAKSQGFIAMSGMALVGTGGGVLTVSPLYKRLTFVGDKMPAILLTRGAPTFAAITDLVLRLQSEVVGAA